MLKKLQKVLGALLNQKKPEANKGSNHGRISYTKQSHAEVEQDAGEKMYQISDGVFVNQRTYDFIHSEEVPVIEDEAIDIFTKIEIEQSNTLAAQWFENDTKLIIFSKTANPNEVAYTIFNFSGETYKRDKAGLIPFSEDMGDFHRVALHQKQKYLLLTFKNHLLIWDFEADMLVKFFDGYTKFLLESGFYPDGTQVWSLVQNEHRTGYKWLVWDYLADSHEIFELETEDHYGRGACLHPSGLLIGALWNAYECGYYIHTFVLGEIRFYRQPAAERGEYENYSPSFSPDGKQFVFVANPYLGMRKNYCKICVYELETGKLIREFYTGFSQLEAQTQFVHGGKRIAFYEAKSKNAHVFNPENGKRLAVLKAAKTIRYFNGHRLAGYYALSHEDGVTVYYTKTIETGNPDEFETSASAVAMKFIEANEAHLAKPNHWEE